MAALPSHHNEERHIKGAFAFRTFVISEVFVDSGVMAVSTVPRKVLRLAGKQ